MICVEEVKLEGQAASTENHFLKLVRFLQDITRRCSSSSLQAHTETSRLSQLGSAVSDEAQARDRVLPGGPDDKAEEAVPLPGMLGGCPDTGAARFAFAGDFPAGVTDVSVDPEIRHGLVVVVTRPERCSVTTDSRHNMEKCADAIQGVLFVARLWLD